FLIAQRVNGVAHLFVGAAAADVAGQAVLDLGGRRLGILFEHGFHRDDEAGRAEAALLGVVAGEGGGNRVELVALNEAFGGADRLALGFEGEGGARVDRLAVGEDSAGAAGAAVAN